MTDVQLMFVAGAQVPATDGATEPVINPANGEQIATVALGSAADVDLAVAAAEGAFDEWAATTPGQRAELLLRLADRLEAHAEEFAQLESANVGKPIAVAREEVPFGVDNMRFFAGAARVLEGRAAGEYSPTHTSIIRRDPLGVVGSVAPWNFPLVMAIWKVCPALMTGNTLVLKPSEQTPLTTLRLAELAADLFPPGVFNVVTGHGGTVGQALVSHPRVRMSSLTGDTATGKVVARVASENLKRLHLELGGKAPVLVFDDCDAELAISKICEGGYGNSGQDCMAASRVYIADGIYDEFARRLTERVKQMKVGNGFEVGVEQGPLINQAAIKKVEAHVQDAKAKGGRVLAGGQRHVLGATFFEPTVIADATSEMLIAHEETFGPVAALFRFKDEQEGIDAANATEFGLAAYFFTRDLARAFRVARAIESGMIGINAGIITAPEARFGGVKDSGIGREGSSHGIEDYLNIKYLSLGGL